jgi:N-acetylglucosamine kinase-like BadF-type ATPase
MSGQQAFYGVGNCAKITASTGSTSLMLTDAGSPRTTTLRVFNGSSAMAHFRTGVGTQTAVVTDTFVAPGSTETFIVPPAHTHVGVILSAGTGSVYVQRGSGL